ncbi:MAG TPA: hypothetical protein VIS74_07585, partial [Chthoniobacterales bacterium]
AKTPEAVYRIQDELELFRDEELSNGARATRPLNDRLNRAINFINNWQQVITAEANGEFAEAVQSIGNLRRNAYASALMGPAALNAKYQSLLAQALNPPESAKESSPIRAAIAAALQKVKTPADAAAALEVLNQVASFSSGDDNRLANHVQNELRGLVEMNHEFAAGAYARVIGRSSDSASGPYARQLESLKNELRLKAIAAANDLPDLGTPPAAEGLPTFIRRLAVEAFEKKDWERLYTLLSVYSTLTGGGCARTQDMKQGVSAYLAGQQLEQAGQFGDAVSQYTLCLTYLGKLIPRADAAKALDRLRLSHPEAFAPAGNLRGAN